MKIEKEANLWNFYFYLSQFQATELMYLHTIKCASIQTQYKICEEYISDKNQLFPSISWQARDSELKWPSYCSGKWCFKSGASQHRFTIIEMRQPSFLGCILIHDAPIFCLSKWQSTVASAIDKNQAIVTSVRNPYFPCFRYSV